MLISVRCHCLHTKFCCTQTRLQDHSSCTAQSLLVLYFSKPGFASSNLNNGYRYVWFLGAFAKSRKATIKRRHVRPFACNNFAHIGRMFFVFDIWLVFILNSVLEMELSLKSDQGNGYFIWRLMFMYTYERGHVLAQLVEALRYKSEGRGFDSLWCHLNFSLT
jgi:hypothetical protein